MIDDQYGNKTKVQTYTIIKDDDKMPTSSKAVDSNLLIKSNDSATVLSSNKADVYSAIKKLTVCDIGIPSQVSWE